MASDVGDLEFFATLAAAGTMTEAARHWGVSVSVVSRRLKSLEHRLGAPLANRGARGLELTAEGRQYRARGSEILQALQDLESSINPDPRDLTGAVRVVCTVGFGRIHVAPLLREFHDRHPGTDCFLELTSRPLSASLPGFDLAVHVGRVPDSTLAMRHLLPNRRVLVASPAYIDAHGAPTDLSELRAHDLLVVRENEGESSWRFIDAGKEVAVPVRGRLVCNDGLAVTDWCLDGAGIAMRSSWHVDEYLRRGTLVEVLPHIGTPDANIVALFGAATHTPPRVRALVEHLRTGLAARFQTTAAARSDQP